MNTIEFYSDDILDVVSLGQLAPTFDETNGDYIKMELRDSETDVVLYTFYSNRLLLEHEVGGYYFGDYHYNQTTEYFMEGSKHIDKPHSNLLPTRFDKSVIDITDTYYTHEKQFNIYRDARYSGRGNRIYIKPNEILEKINLKEGKFKLRLYFLRDIKSLISGYLQSPKVFEPGARYVKSPITDKIEVVEPEAVLVKIIPNLIPLYRFWNSTNRKHYYTTNQTEYENLISNPNYKNWKFERIECYIPHIIMAADIAADIEEGDVSYG